MINKCLLINIWGEAIKESYRKLVSPVLALKNLWAKHLGSQVYTSFKHMPVKAFQLLKMEVLTNFHPFYSKKLIFAKKINHIFNSIV